MGDIGKADLEALACPAGGGRRRNVVFNRQIEHLSDLHHIDVNFNLTG